MLSQDVRRDRRPDRPVKWVPGPKASAAELKLRALKDAKNVREARRKERRRAEKGPEWDRW